MCQQSAVSQANIQECSMLPPWFRVRFVFSYRHITRQNSLFLIWTLVQLQLSHIPKPTTRMAETVLGLAKKKKSVKVPRVYALAGMFFIKRLKWFELSEDVSQPWWTSSKSMEALWKYFRTVRTPQQKMCTSLLQTVSPTDCVGATSLNVANKSPKSPASLSGQRCPSIPLWGTTDSSTLGHSAYLQTKQQPTLAIRIFLDALLQREPRIVRSVEH